MNFYTLLCCFILTALPLISCKQNNEAPKPEPVKRVQVDSAFVTDTLNNNLADALSGKYEPYKQDKGYLSASQLMQAEWENLKVKKLDPIRSWMQTNYDSVAKNATALYYPFGGPDFSYAYAFYPGVKDYVLVGLEPVGNLKSLQSFNLNSSTQFLRDMKQILFYSIRYGFFRTKDMHRQLTEKSGVVNVLLYFMKQYNAKIGKIAFYKWDSAGLFKQLTADDNSKSDCVQIEFEIDGTPHSLYYFTQDLSNSGLKKLPAFTEWLSRHNNICSLVKSASYLMHDNSFSDTRDFILNKSIIHIQDDSGIKYNAMLKTNRLIDLWGKYTHTISLFSFRIQSDLKNAYVEKKAKELPFTIGYNVVFGQTNLQVMH